MFDLLTELTSSTKGFEIFEERITPQSSWKSLKIRGVFQRADTKNQNGRIYPYKVLDRAIQECSESLLSRNMFGELDHPCLTDSNFSILTIDGWKEFKDITSADKVWSLVNGNAVISQIEGVINKPYHGDVYTITGKNINSTFTAPHKMVLCTRKSKKLKELEFRVTVEEIANNRSKFTHSPIPKTASFIRNASNIFTIPAVDVPASAIGKQYKDLEMPANIFAAFMGIYLAEGHSNKSSYNVFISQKTPWSKEYIKTEILDKLSPELKWHEYNNGFGVNDARLNLYLRKLGNKYSKYIPSEVKALDATCLKELLYWFSIGDGRMVGPKTEKDISLKQAIAKSVRYTLKSKYTKIQLFSVSEKLVDDLHECLIYCGKSGSRTIVESTADYIYAGRTIKAENKVPLHVLTISSAKNIYLSNATKIEKKQYKGNIYCLTTTHGNFYMKQNGKAFWTGNCDQSPTVSLKNVSHVVTNLKFVGNEVIGEATVFDDPGPAGTPAGRLLGALIRNDCTVGISSRGYGSVTNDYKDTVVEEYKLVTFDCVHDPSTQKAFVQPVNEGTDFERQLKIALERKQFINELRAEFSTLKLYK